jgi:hypothetical protein
MAEKMYLVVGKADGGCWFVAVYEDEESAKMHARLATREALGLAIQYRGHLKAIPRGQNVFDPEMDTEKDVADYYTREVRVGTIQVRSCESLDAGEAGCVSPDGPVVEGVGVEGKGSQSASGVREGGTPGVRGLLPAGPSVGERSTSGIGLLGTFRTVLFGKG